MDGDKLINSLFGSPEALWVSIKKFALIGSVEATRMMLQMYYCLKAPTTSAFDKTIIVLGLGYQLLPKDALPIEKYKILGLFDNAITLTIAYTKIMANITPEIANQVEAILSQWFPNRIGQKNFQSFTSAVPLPPVVIPVSEKTAEEEADDDLVVD